MQKTTNYQLNQWEPSDPIRREDFNQDNAAIDAALAANVYKVGTYTGNGAELADGGQFIELGFKPRFVLFSRGQVDFNTNALATFMLTEHQVSGAERYATLNETGFTVGLCSDAGTSVYKLNVSGVNYSFVAFQ